MESWLFILALSLELLCRKTALFISKQQILREEINRLLGSLFVSKGMGTHFKERSREEKRTLYWLLVSRYLQTYPRLLFNASCYFTISCHNVTMVQNAVVLCYHNPSVKSHHLVIVKIETVRLGEEVLLRMTLKPYLRSIRFGCFLSQRCSHIYSLEEQQNPGRHSKPQLVL